MNLFRALKSNIAKSPAIAALQLPISGVFTLFVSDVCGLALLDGMDPVTLTREMNQYCTSVHQRIREAGGRIVNFTGDATIAIWGPSHVQPMHAELAMQCGRAILQQRQNEQSQLQFCPHLCILIATGKMTGAMIGGQIQFVGDPWITTKRLEAFRKSKKSQMLYASEALARLCTPEAPKPIGHIKEGGGTEVPVFEYTP